MSELIKITEQEGKQVVSARDLHTFLEATERFSSWFDRQLQYGFEENVDYVGCKVFNALANQELDDFAIDVNMAKELSMLSKSEKGKQARKYFIEMEKIAKDLQEINPKIPKTFREALLLAAEQQLLIEEQASKIEVMKPKEVFFDQVTGSSNAFDMADVAKVCNLGVGRNTLFKFLRDTNILRENNTPYQQYCDSGYFRVIESKYNKPDGSVHISLKTVVYQKGIDFIIKRFVGRKLNNN